MRLATVTLWSTSLRSPRTTLSVSETLRRGKSRDLQHASDLCRPTSAEDIRQHARLLGAGQAAISLRLAASRTGTLLCVLRSTMRSVRRLTGCISPSRTRRMEPHKCVGLWQSMRVALYSQIHGTLRRCGRGRSRRTASFWCLVPTTGRFASASARFVTTSLGGRPDREARSTREFCLVARPHNTRVAC